MSFPYPTLLSHSAPLCDVATTNSILATVGADLHILGSSEQFGHDVRFKRIVSRKCKAKTSVSNDCDFRSSCSSYSGRGDDRVSFGAELTTQGTYVLAPFLGYLLLSVSPGVEFELARVEDS